MKKLSLFFITGLSFVSANAQNLSVSLTPVQYPNGYNISANGVADGSINATVNNAVGPVTFEWNDNVTTEDRTNLAAGTYTVIVTDSLDSTATATVTLTQPAALQPLVVIYQKSSFPGGYNVSSFGTANGSITLTVTGGLSPYHFLWNDGIVQKDRTNLSAGVYSVLVTDSLGDSATATINMLQPGQPLSVQINTSGGNPCGGAVMPMLNAMVSGGTPPYQYQWLREPDFVLAETWSMIYAMIPGTYHVLVTDANADSANAVYTLQPSPMMLSAMVNTIFYPNMQPFSCDTCHDARLYVNAYGGTPPYTYLWSGGQTTDTITGLAPSPMSYSVTVTDANGCMAYGNYTLYNAPPPPPPMMLMVYGYSSMFPGTGNVSCDTCADGSITLSVNGGTMPYTFIWSNGATTQSLTNIDTGFYSVTVTDMLGATSNQSFNIMFYSMPPPPPPMGLMVMGYPSTFPGTGNVSCATCNDGFISLMVNGGMPPYTFDWSNDSTTQNISGLDTGYYSVTVTDMNGATATQGFNIMFYSMPPPPPPMGLMVYGYPYMYPGTGNVSCGTCSDGSITLSVSGGMPPYTFDWSNDSTSQNITNIDTGYYSVTVTDMNGATSTQGFNILFYSMPPPPPPMGITLNVSKSELPGGYNVSCSSCTDGYANIWAMGGMPPFTLYWNNVVFPGWMNGTNINNLGQGTYFIKVVDMNGDSATASVTLLAPSNQVNVQLSSTIYSAGCNGGPFSADLYANVMGGTPPYTYQWSGPMGNMPEIWGSIWIGQQGIYYVTVTDANNATAQASVNVFPPASVNVQVEAVQQYGNAHTACNAADGKIRIHLQGGTVPYFIRVDAGGGMMKRDYMNGNGTGDQNMAQQNEKGFYREISTSDTLIEIDSLAAGWYNVNVNDMSGCGNGNGVELRQAEPPSVSVSGTEYENGYYFSCDTCHDAQMTAVVSGGSGNTQYYWFEIPAEHVMMTLKGASLFMSENKDFNMNDLPPAVSTSQTATIANAETLHGLVVADGLGCVGFTNFTLEKPKPVNAWGFAGNYGAGKWLGTRDSSDLVIKTNNTERVRVFAGGNVSVKDTLKTEFIKVERKAIFDTLVVNRIIGQDSLIYFGDSTIVFQANMGKIYNDETGPFKGIGLGKGQGNTGTLAFGRNSTAIGYNVRTYPNATNSVVIGSSTGVGNMLKNELPNTLMVGFNSNIPTFYVGSSSGNWTTGRVGVGTASPWMKFQVDAGTDNGLLVRTNHSAGWGIGLSVDVSHDQTRAIIVNKPDVNGVQKTNFLVWGTGDVWAREFHVTLDDFYDYVFDEDYQLMPLPELEQYLIKNKHLPEIPSADDIKKNGMSMAEMEALLVKKVEELTLYMIQVNKENEKLKKEINELKNNK